MTRSYTSDQLALEAEMAERGALRTRNIDSKARKSNTMSVTTSGRAMLRKIVSPVADSLDGWIAHDQAHKAGKPGYRPVVRETLSTLGTDVVAMLACQAVVDGMHRPRTVTSVASSIGTSLEDEYRFRILKKNNKAVWEEGMRRIKRLAPKRRRKVLQGLGKFHGGLPDRWINKERIRLGVLALDAVLVNTELATIETWTRGRRAVNMLVPTAELIAWLESSLDAAALNSPLHLPCVDEPIPWEAPEGGGYLTHLVLSRPIARFRLKEQRSALDDPETQPETAYEALNAMQRTHWRVHPEVLSTLESMWEGAGGVAGLPEREDHPLPPKPVDIATNEDARKAWRREASAAYRANAERRSKRALVAMVRSVAKQFSGGPFYLPHRLDFRGRAYPIPYFLQPQGPDLAKGLLEFERGERMTEEGWRAFYVHGANCWGAKGTLVEREEAGMLLGASDNSATGGTAWQDADEPWQFLAWCQERWRLLNEGPLTRLPIHVDASNNGLQLFALMTGDRELAKWTNAIEDPNGAVHDIYVEIAGRATEELRKRVEEDEHKLSVMAQQWLELLGDEGIPRICTKRPVMTLPYGVTLYSAQAYVRDWYRGTYGKDGPFGTSPGKPCMLLARVILGEVHKMCSGAVAAMGWLRKACTVANEAGQHFHWIAPSGWPVVQHYRMSKSLQIRADLAGAVRTLRIREDGSKVHRRQEILGASPNFVHSVDAAVLHTALSQWTGPISAVHDSFGTLAPLMPALLDTLRAAVVTCTLEAKPLTSLRESVMRYTRTPLEEPPCFGTIEPDEVLRSTYLFS